MTRAKDGNGEGNKQHKQAGPALFPRLHVAETKRVGPRAPPRNKMALYEQFTIPSHRFRSSPIPLASSAHNSINPSMSPALVPLFPPQAGSYDGRYSYVPCYMNPMSPALAYVPSIKMGHFRVAGQVSMNGTSSSTVVDGDTELQQVPCVAESSVRTSAPICSKKGMVDNDCTAPTNSAVTHTSGLRRSSLSASQSQEAASRGHHHSSMKTRNSGKEKRSNIESPGGSNQLQLHQRERNVDTSKQAGGLSEQNGGLSELIGGLSWHTGSLTASVDDSNVREHDIEQRDTDVEIHSQEIDLPNIDRDGAQQSQPSPATAPNRLQEAERLRGQTEQNHYSSETSENVSGEVSEQTGQGCSSDESESSMLDYVPVESVTPHDVMIAIGQQQFWQARKAILRQQKMFSVQVFELHRVMEVQRQMAMRPNLSDEDEVEEQELEQEDQQQVPSPAPVTQVPPHVPELPTKCVEHNGIKQCNANQQAMKAAPKLMYPVPFPHQQGFLPGQPWQAALYAANGPCAQMAPPYMYLPYPPPYPPPYGYHPPMHPNMMMYEQNGVQHAQMPLWQQQECSYGSGALRPGSAQYRVPPHVPVMEATQQGVTVFPSNYFHPLVQRESLGASSQMHLSNPTGKQGGGQSHKAAQAQDDGWAKGWGTYQSHMKQRDEAQQGRECEGAQLQRQQYSEKVAAAVGMREVEPKQAYEGTVSDPLPLFPLSPVPNRSMPQRGVIKVVPRAVLATPESTADILLSIQQERQQE